MITTLDQMVGNVLTLGKKQRIAVAWAHDPNTLSALETAVNEGFAEALLIGKKTDIELACCNAGVNGDLFKIVGSENETYASVEAVRMVKEGSADIVMKGLVGTDIFLKAVMDREKGLVLPDAVLSYVGAIQIPSYHKLLFMTDMAVIPFPDLRQKISMANYAIEMANRFGITKPKLALISASEKKSRHFPSCEDYVIMCNLVKEGKIRDCIIDGPLDLFLACDKKSVEIKGINTPIDGEADILLFPSLESCNPFYKALMLFAKGELAGLIMGTSKPVIVMSRSESERSKYYCIALACLMAKN